MRRWLVGILVGSVAVSVGVWLIGWSLPVAHTATRSAEVEGEPTEVWEAMTNVESFSSWRPGVDRVERLADQRGLPVWRETGPMGALTMAVEDWSPPSRLVTRIVDDGQPFGGTWTFELAPAARGTRVTITEDGEIYSPFFRFMARFVFGYDGTMESYLEGLADHMAARGTGAGALAGLP